MHVYGVLQEGMQLCNYRYANSAARVIKQITIELSTGANSNMDFAYLTKAGLLSAKRYRRGRDELIELH
jgi:hypothetical protein